GGINSDVRLPPLRGGGIDSSVRLQTTKDERSMVNSRARSLRKRMTQHEVKLWVRLRELKEQGLHFRRQVPRLDYIVDFACLKRRILIEVDGSQHGVGSQVRRDQTRDRILAEDGFVTLRFWNAQIDRNHDSVVETIFAASTEAIVGTHKPRQRGRMTALPSMRLCRASR
ncbi:MAG: endonuclease domain-containing protein, partial [Hyphomicrobiales bacterium]